MVIIETNGSNNQKCVLLGMYMMRYQMLMWSALLVFLFFSYLPMDGVKQSAVYAVINISFYALIIYGNISWLYPRFYVKKRYALYVLLSVCFLLLVGVARSYGLLFVYNHYFTDKPTSLRLSGLLPGLLGTVLVFGFSFVVRIALAYFKIKQQAEEMRVQKSIAELNLLKSRVQPHFLFNTLNNIYYEAYREAPATAALIEKLSNIMRYFVDESQKDRVLLGTELQFIENYISLERIRLRHEIQLIFTRNINEQLLVPPMLLMTFVENVFKHGIDRMSTSNRVVISLEEKAGYLLFSTENACNTVQERESGFGIDNLRKRLSLLFGNNFILATGCTNNIYRAFLKIPVACV